MAFGATLLIFAIHLLFSMFLIYYFFPPSLFSSFYLILLFTFSFICFIFIIIFFGHFVHCLYVLTFFFSGNKKPFNSCTFYFLSHRIANPIHPSAVIRAAQERAYPRDGWCIRPRTTPTRTHTGSAAFAGASVEFRRGRIAGVAVLETCISFQYLLPYLSSHRLPLLPPSKSYT